MFGIGKISILALCGMLATASAQAETKQEIQLTFTEPARILSLAPFYVAIENGFFAEEGIKAKIASGGGGREELAALLSGQAQFSISGPRLVFTGIEAGEKLVAIQSLNSSLTFQIAVTNTFLKAKNVTADSPFADRVAALSGARISTNVIGDSGDVYMRYLLKSQGHDPNSVQMFKLTGNGAKISGMQADIVDGGIASPPFPMQAKKLGVGDLLIKASELPMYEKLVWEVVIAKRDYVEKNPEITRKVIKAIGNGIKFARENPAKAAELVQPYFEGVDVGLIEASLKGMTETFQGYGEMVPEAWKNAQTPLLEFSDLSGVSIEHDSAEGAVWTNQYIRDVFAN